MSLALIVDAGRCDATPRFTAAIGSVLFVALMLVVLERSADADPGAPWWPPLGCALACAAWSFRQWRRSVCRPLHQLRLSDRGRLFLAAGGGGRPHDAVLVGGWRLGPLVCLRVSATSKVDPDAIEADDPQSTADFAPCECSFLLARSSFDEASWRGLHRWLVWHRRSRRSAVVAA